MIGYFLHRWEKRVGSEENGIQSKDLGELRSSDHNTNFQERQPIFFLRTSFLRWVKILGLGFGQMDSFT